MTKSVGLTVLQQFKNKWGSIGLILWLPFTVFVTYQCRYWVNSDTIGSLDAARAIRELDLTFAVNGYFGSGFAVLLSALPDSNLQSFFAHHLLSTAVILLTQYTIYQTLRLLRIRTLISGLLATVWAAGMFATGPGIYLTADIILCFLSALYVYFVVKGLVLQSEEMPQARAFISLGI
ncbi:MAG: hypothetical protein OEU36_10490, partial [Gammaproteobacteria bacterium]|nr:hypothetical protein [Gammaproteobacteria bacterium]